jgi:hypothetical protein
MDWQEWERSQRGRHFAAVVAKYTGVAMDIRPGGQYRGQQPDIAFFPAIMHLLPTRTGSRRPIDNGLLDLPLCSQIGINFGVYRVTGQTLTQGQDQIQMRLRRQTWWPRLAEAHITH